MPLDYRLQFWVILQALWRRAATFGALYSPGIGKVENRFRHKGFPKIKHFLKFCAGNILIAGQPENGNGWWGDQDMGNVGRGIGYCVWGKEEYNYPRLAWVPTQHPI